MRSAPLIVVFGISGVGKSHLTRIISARRPDILYLSAGALLKDALAKNSEHLRTASRDSIFENQMILADSVRAARDHCWQKTVILEAHSIIDNDLDLIVIPFDAIRNLQIAGIIVIEESIHDIMHRRETDIRFRPARSIQDLERQQQLSNDTAYQYATELSVPIKRLSSKDYDAALCFIAMIEKIRSY